ncbi:bifunctional metallophosphatase/5'-nucleotidase [Moheibacter sediminis]|uniref:5'-nucleotidase n=1 Tax=Moheibacter sediminis TaxID=1434700 RepID=A0A1W2AF26_9FLAO|nr:metallophosphoesterase [Moheibacter sediminis]SMC59234.1 5'-nucleotidase [Moheibacter sediminis]
METRREFIKKAGAASLLTIIPGADLLAGELNQMQKITILHTNDQHSRIEPFEVSSDERTSNKGGFARRAALIHKIRQEEPNVLLLDAGDVFQGTPYFNYYGGELEYKLMTQMGYDASTIGNHEFDNGLEGILKQLPHAGFDIICSNYDFSNTILDGKFKPFQIYKKEGVKIGVFGLGIQLEGLVGKEMYGDTRYLDPIKVAQGMVRFLRQEKECELVICLSHLGYEYKNDPKKVSDIHLAQKTSGIDLIIGGHTHTFLPEPQQFKNKDGKMVLVNQVGWAGLYLGRIDFYMEKRKIKRYFTYNLNDYSIGKELMG